MLDRKLLPYLTPEAMTLWKKFVKQGVDEDLALRLIELELSEEEVFDLPEES